LKVQARHFKGFTLLEVLVVLVIVTMLVTFLFQTLSHVLTVRLTILRQIATFQQGAIQEFWFRYSTSGLIADYPDIENNHVFTGDKQHFSGLTTTALNSDAGVPVPFGWFLVQENQQNELRYQTQAETWTILTWSDDSYLSSFQYLDKEGHWVEQWPPKQFGITPPQLPEAIMLIAKRNQHIITWVVAVSALRSPKADLRLREF